MFLEVIRFEFKYRLNRPATYLYFALFFFFSLLVTSWDGLRFNGEAAQVKKNASSALFNVASVFSLIPGLFVASAVMGVAVLRDFEHKIESILFTTSITKPAYLAGRFLGSFCVLLLISSGFVWGAYLGCHMPWVDASRYLPVSMGQFAWPWLVMIVPNLFLLSCIFFAAGALGRKMIVVTLQSFILLALFTVAGALTKNMENTRLASLIDPSGSLSVSSLSRYWTVSDKNSLTIPLGGVLALNRLIWCCIGLLIAGVSYALFRFRAVYSERKRRSQIQPVEQSVRSVIQPLVYPALNFGYGLQARQLFTLTSLYLKEVIRSAPFIAIVAVGLLIIVTSSTNAFTYYGQEVYPLSAIIAEYIVLYAFTFIITIVITYAAQLIWRERDVGFDQLFDSLPISDSLPILAKFLALVGILLLFLLSMIPVGMALQLSKGFYSFQPGVYLSILGLGVFIPMIFYIAVNLFFQTVVSNKFAGFALSTLLFAYIFFSGQAHINYRLLVPGSGTAGAYSDMSGFSVDMTQFWVLKIFWLGTAGLLLTLAIRFYPRGEARGDTGLNWRGVFKSPQHSSRLLRTLAMSSLVVTIASGVLFYYNTSVRNTYRTNRESEDLEVAYEKTLKADYGKALQPDVVNIKGTVDVFPERHGLTVACKVTYKNLMNRPVLELLVSEPSDPWYRITNLSFDAPTQKIKHHKDLSFIVYHLSKPLLPGDSLTMSFKGERVRRGFDNDGIEVNYASNGTFINNGDIFPSLGYNKRQELSGNTARKKRHLKDVEGTPLRSDTLAKQYNLFGQRGRTGVDLTVSTSVGQTAIVPGYLQRSWKSGDRAFYHYRMDKPIFNFYNISSGAYSEEKSTWKGVNLTLYHHEGRRANLTTMMNALKDGLDYYTANFSPYQYRQVRIIEFPRYRQIAQSFPGTIPFSEGLGFIYQSKPGALDMTYYLTAHELAHQWWGHQVCEAGTRGAQIFSESLAQYSAIMVLKHKLPMEELSKYLKYELDGYLSGRASETKDENPLDETDGQAYIHYKKGTLAFFAMQDYIGEAAMNKALRKLIANYGNKDVYPTSDVLVRYIKEVTPDSLQFAIDDLYSKITLFANNVTSPTAAKVNGKYVVHIPVRTTKYYANGAGIEKQTPIKDYIDIGVFSLVDGKEKLVYLKRTKFTTGGSVVTVYLKEKPVRAGIDPIHKLIDRNTDDNIAAVKIVEGS